LSAVLKLANGNERVNVRDNKIKVKLSTGVRTMLGVCGAGVVLDSDTTNFSTQEQGRFEGKKRREEKKRQRQCQCPH
jgi:hypothetical protein